MNALLLQTARGSMEIDGTQRGLKSAPYGAMQRARSEGQKRLDAETRIARRLSAATGRHRVVVLGIEEEIDGFVTVALPFHLTPQEARDLAADLCAAAERVEAEQ